MNNAPVRVRHLGRAVTIWAVGTAIGILLLILLGPHLADWKVLPPVASDRTGEIDNVLFLFTLLSIPVFVFVVVFAFYSAFAWGSRVRPQAEGPAILVNPGFQRIWIIVSIVLVVFLYIYGLAFLNQVTAQAGSDALQVSVTGEQWLWDFSYPQYNNVGSSQLELVVNRPVAFTINSIDVQHSFWIPAFGIKQDAVPGETTHINATPNTLGTFVVRCAELCGIYHAYMEVPVHVVSQSDFDAWIARQEPSAPASSSGFRQPVGVPDTAIVERRSIGLVEG